MRVLYLDIETAPLEVHTWGLWNQNIGINQIIKPTEMISFAAKYRGEKKKHFYSIHHHGKDAMVKAAWALLDECDVLGTWNGKKFDEKHLKREFIEAGMTPPSPWKSLDLLGTARSQFLFPSNKLQYVSTVLGLAGKVQHSGFSLWTACLAGDEKAWRKMRTYNIQDVVLLEELHDKLLPWIKGHPHVGLYDNTESDSCQRCGGTQLEKRGFAYTPLGKFQQYRCDGCGSWSRGKKSLASVDVRGVQ